LQENGRVVCAELASQMQVSEHTIRRDLQELSHSGMCKRSTAARYYRCRKPGIFTVAK
jgi:DeoR/GlpR family transcriptional regulator of sugar metabolism